MKGHFGSLRRRWTKELAAVGMLLTLTVATASPALAAGSSAADRMSPSTGGVTVQGGGGMAPESPVPVSGSSSSAPASTYSTTYLDDSESMLDQGVDAVSSTDPGTFALTGLALDAETGTEVSGATVSLTPSGTGTTYSATTDANGGYAFINIPISGSSQDYDLTVSAGSYGSYSVLNNPYDASEGYYATAELTSTAQSYDESNFSIEDATLGPERSGAANYPSQTRVPPSIQVSMYHHVSSCGGGSFERVRNYPWKFYVLHVAVGEIDSRWHQTAWKANASAEQNYAWYQKQGSRRLRRRDHQLHQRSMLSARKANTTKQLAQLADRCARQSGSEWGRRHRRDFLQRWTTL